MRMRLSEFTSWLEEFNDYLHVLNKAVKNR